MTVVYVPAVAEQFERAVRLLREGAPVGLPTETVYGLAAPALRPASLAKIFALKNRPTFDPLIVHVLGAPSWRAALVGESGSLHERLMEAFWPGPLTLLFRKSAAVPDLCTASTPWVALRSPDHPVFRRVLEALGEPLAAPSANRFGRISPTTATDVVKELGPFGLAAVLDGGPCRHGLESTVVKVLHETRVEVLRLGALSVESLREVLGPGVDFVVRASGSGIDEGQAAEAPGLLKSHYAPRCPLYLWDELSEHERTYLSAKARNYALFSVFPPPAAVAASAWCRRETLSADGNSIEAAARLFARLRALDEAAARGDFGAIVVKLADGDGGLCPAIHDRLRRASSAISLSE